MTAHASPPWLIGPVTLSDCLGEAGERRFFELIGPAGGLTPTEARPWFDLPTQEWQRVEHLAFIALDGLEQRGATLPWHLVRWLDRIRDQSGPATSLFD